MHTRVRVAQCGTTLCRDVVFAFVPSGGGCGCSRHLCDRLVCLEVLVLRCGRESLDCTVDTFRVQLVHLIPAEAEFVHGSGVEVLDKDICALNQFCKDGLTVRGGGIECERFLVAVELKEIIAWAIGIELKFVSGCIARAGTFNFDNFCTKPCKHLCARRAGLHIGEVDHFDSLKRSGVHSNNIIFS